MIQETLKTVPGFDPTLLHTNYSKSSKNTAKTAIEKTNDQLIEKIIKLLINHKNFCHFIQLYHTFF